jgi:hypothetical protein
MGFADVLVHLRSPPGIFWGLLDVDARGSDVLFDDWGVLGDRWVWGWLGGKGTLVLRITLEFGFRVGGWSRALVLLWGKFILGGWDLHVGFGLGLRFYDNKFARSGLGVYDDLGFRLSVILGFTLSFGFRIILILGSLLDVGFRLLRFLGISFKLCILRLC